MSDLRDDFHRLLLESIKTASIIENHNNRGFHRFFSGMSSILALCLKQFDRSSWATFQAIENFLGYKSSLLARFKYQLKQRYRADTP